MLNVAYIYNWLNIEYICMHATFNNYILLALCTDTIDMRERERERFKIKKNIYFTIVKSLLIVSTWIRGYDQ